ncbi:actin-related protein [Collybia nuda]|uniref:Actin-related protein n=1 Tax=Collybia nuda TaxID=64659 RepID=A0A9P5Y2Q8_9AGAR|nr:actin-related protein [Collybia nuda]
MPRGIPNAKRDETGMRYTMFNVPLVPNPKHMSTTYLKSESQTLWARNASRKGKATDEGNPAPPDTRRGAQVIVIHPGSRFLRIGKASDVNPLTVTNVIARKCKPPVPAAARVEGVSRPQKARREVHSSTPERNDDENAVVASDDPFDAKIAAITVSLRDRMRFYKLRVTANATSIASTFNAQFKPEIIADHNDPYHVEWLNESCPNDILFGEQALRLADPQRAGYVTRWPIHGTGFNTRDYPSIQFVLGDLEAILRNTLKEKFNIGGEDYSKHSVVLVIPDFYDRSYVRDFVDLLLVTMGFKQICAQQESLAATYGAGISNACVVNIGATTTNIACVDEGLVLSETRMTLNMGGDDITEFLYVLLERISFPYKDIDLARSYDWNIMEDLKSRLCTLAEGDVALNLYDFVVRRPDRPAEKYGLRAYDETILAPMCLFEPRVIEFERKRLGLKPRLGSGATEEIIEHQADQVTNAMMISTQHLMPTVAPADSNDQPQKQGGSESQPGVATPAEQQEVQPMAVDDQPVLAPPNLFTDGIEIIDVEDESKAATPSLPTPSAKVVSNTPPVHPGGFEIDVCFEASKLPLDVAIFNSARAAGGDEKIRKYLQAVLVIGGTAHIPGMGHALESRLQAIATPLVPNMEKVQIIPPPKEVDPRVLPWKGASVLGKMDGVSDLWLTKSDWDILGMRGLKERCFYL